MVEPLGTRLMKRWSADEASVRPELSIEEGTLRVAALTVAAGSAPAIAITIAATIARRGTNELSLGGLATPVDGPGHRVLGSMSSPFGGPAGFEKPRDLAAPSPTTGVAFDRRHARLRVVGHGPGQA